MCTCTKSCRIVRLACLWLFKTLAHINFIHHRCVYLCASMCMRAHVSITVVCICVHLCVCARMFHSSPLCVSVRINAYARTCFTTFYFVCMLEFR